MTEPGAVRDLLERAADSGLGGPPAAAPVQALVSAGRTRTRRRRWRVLGGLAVVAVLAVGGSVLFTGRYWLGSHQVPGFGGYRSVECGGVRVALSALPGRPVDANEHGGPAEGLDQVYRLYEWSRKTPYDTATWTLVVPRDGVALLVATAPGTRTYVPVRQQPDGHWLAFPACDVGR